MTRREFYVAVSNGEMNDEIMGIAAAELEKLNAANEKRKGVQSKKAAENQPIIDRIVNEILTDEPMTATDVAGVLELTVQKTSALCRAAVKQNQDKVGQTDVKIKGKGTQKGYFLIG